MLNLLTKNLFPPKCLSCSVYVDNYDNLCEECFRGLIAITEPFCDKCAEPLDYIDQDCAYCAEHKPEFDKARVAFEYNDVVQGLVSGLKYYDKTDYAKFLGSGLYMAVKDILPEVDIITSVPIHPKRRFGRKFNQSTYLLKILEKLCDNEINYNLIKRIRNTPPQASLSRDRRRENIVGAFKVNGDVQGRNVLVVDDVITTGSTLSEIAKILKDAGAKNVFVGCVAKTVLY